ncbi:hypothetical protein ACP4CO_004990, partial [Escherichia coli]
GPQREESPEKWTAGGASLLKKRPETSGPLFNNPTIFSVNQKTLKAVMAIQTPFSARNAAEEGRAGSV